VCAEGDARQVTAERILEFSTIPTIGDALADKGPEDKKC
jgi:hypothetical protein